MKHGIAVLLAALILTGCLSVDTTINLGRDGSGRLEVVYSIDADLYGLGVFDDSDNALPVPVSRKQFVDTVAQNPGLRLTRYRMREDDGTVTISARLRFDSLDALNSWYGGETAIRLSQSESGSTWSQLLYPGAGATSASSVALAESLAQYSISYRIEPPATVISAGAGQIADGGKAATITVSLADIVTATTPVYWEVSW